VVLSSDQLDAADQIGFRAIGRYDICALSVVEFGYTGIYDFSDSATVTDTSRPGNLYSLFSRPTPGTGNFGINPPTVSTGINPLPFTEQAIQQSISFKSDLQTAEISYRRYWLGWSPRISGTLLAGFRYTKVNEDFEFDSLGSPNTFTVSNPAFEYRTDAVNNLSGFQAGGDGWISLTQGLRLGAEGKAGIYDNHYNLQSSILEGNVGSLSNVITPDKFDGDKVAFIGEASVDLVADITPSISLRAGYEVLFLDSLVLAGDNFNQTSPFGNQGTRVPFVDNDGKLFYSGAHAGVEYTW
jgi:putative beta barrel porin BBP7